LQFRLQEIQEYLDKYCKKEIVEIVFTPFKEVVNKIWTDVLPKQSVQDSKPKSIALLQEGNDAKASPVKKEEQKSSSSAKDCDIDYERDLDGKPVQLSDFEILECVGEGSFGKVFKVRNKNNLKVFAMKAMKKQKLI
jgi:hypothetical protein